MKLDHIGIIVKSIDDSLKIWQGLFGLKLHMVKNVLDQKVKVAILKLGETYIELIEPADQESSVYKFLEKRGEGLHHLCFEVDDIEKMLSEMKKNGIKLIDEAPRIGATGKKIAFVRPKNMGGVLIELCEKVVCVDVKCRMNPTATDM